MGAHSSDPPWSRSSHSSDLRSPVDTKTQILKEALNMTWHSTISPHFLLAVPHQQIGLVGCTDAELVGVLRASFLHSNKVKQIHPFSSTLYLPLYVV